MPLGASAAPRRRRRPRSRLSPIGWALVATLVVAVAGAAGWAALTGAPAAPVAAAPPAPIVVSAGRAVPPAVPPVRQPPAVRVLRDWDERRAAAYASGSVPALRELYVGTAGAADVRLLRSYRERGYRVEELRMQLLAVSVRAHRPGRWVLRVTDRLAGGVAVTAYGERLVLPRDRATTRTIRLERGADGRWRVVSVRG